MKIFIHATKNLFLIALALTLLCGLMYVTAQQVLRQSANDPQIQLAEDAAAALAEDKAPPELQEKAAAFAKIDMRQTLAPFLIRYDDDRQPISSTVELNGKTPVPPAGVFEFARTHGENRLTWQPERGVRNATVLVHYSGHKSGFVLAGRSLREVETRVPALGRLILAGWIGSMLGLGITAVALRLIGGAPGAVGPDPGQSP